MFVLSLVFNLNDGGASRSRDDSERPVLHVRLDTRVSELTSNQTLGIEDSVGSIHSSLGLGGITNQTFGFGEGDIGRGGTVTLVVGNDFDTVVLPDTNTRVGGSKIDTDGFSGYSCRVQGQTRRKLVNALYRSFVGKIHENRWLLQSFVSFENDSWIENQTAPLSSQ